RRGRQGDELPHRRGSGRSRARAGGPARAGRREDPRLPRLVRTRAPVGVRQPPARARTAGGRAAPLRRRGGPPGARRGADGPVGTARPAQGGGIHGTRPCRQHHDIISGGDRMTDRTPPADGLVVVSGNPRPGSRTLAVAEAVARRLAPALGLSDGDPGEPVDLALLAPEVLTGSPTVTAARERVAAARVVVVATPAYQASYTGLLQAFLGRY